MYSYIFRVAPEKCITNSKSGWQRFVRFSIFCVPSYRILFEQHSTVRLRFNVIIIRSSILVCLPSQQSSSGIHVCIYCGQATYLVSLIRLMRKTPLHHKSSERQSFWSDCCCLNLHSLKFWMRFFWGFFQFSHFKMRLAIKAWLSASGLIVFTFSFLVTDIKVLIFSR